MTSAHEQAQPVLIRLRDTDRVIPETDVDIRGRKVTDRNGEKLGKVADLLVDDAASHVRFLVVEDGGLLGIGATESFIPVGAVTDVGDDEVQVNQDLKMVAGAPVYDPEIALEPKFYQDVYGYYGITPYWTPGPAPQGVDRGAAGPGR